MSDPIQECKKLSETFWKCLEKHQNSKNIKVNCGKEFYYLYHCINKIP